MESVIYGIHAVQAALTEQVDQIREICVAEDRKDKRIAVISKDAKQAGIRVKRMNKDSFNRLCKTHKLPEQGIQGVLAMVVEMSMAREEQIEDILNAVEGDPFVLVLDGVTDPHNLGACLRSADASGVNLVIAPKDKSAPLNATAIKVACGAASTVPYVQVTNLSRTLEMLKDRGIWFYGAAGETDATIHQTSLTGPVGIVMGAEGTGLRRLTREHCDGLMKIPMVGTMESLNVSVATGIILFEVLRQRTL
ncbi:23S rRNA (guanosine(2251)-2'-O)-methyltransferase RlmB [Salinibius halmophilus]|uniref:23S rRNA (guanosine(2251)-2'-O)-methyltransferase RlmB n=1 Tax=Salinibius halmophilus TaxID=1853216 RepID=UPI000E669428|nr:23S rRNA (guanosine(2251)-2'-O)-methyltransferase RlmB [Salinibius halmophilus]